MEVAFFSTLFTPPLNPRNIIESAPSSSLEFNQLYEYLLAPCSAGLTVNMVWQTRSKDMWNFICNFEHQLEFGFYTPGLRYLAIGAFFISAVAIDNCSLKWAWSLGPLFGLAWRELLNIVKHAQRTILSVTCQAVYAHRVQGNTMIRLLAKEVLEFSCHSRLETTPLFWDGRLGWPLFRLLKIAGHRFI